MESVYFFDFALLNEAIDSYRAKEGNYMKDFGISRNTMQRIREGKEVRISTLVNICNTLQKSPGVFFAEKINR